MTNGKPIPVWYDIARPNEDTGFPGAIVHGWYLVKKDKHGRDVLRLTDADGNPDSYRHVLGPNEKPSAVACALLRQREDDRNPGGDFHRVLDYGPSGWR